LLFDAAITDGDVAGDRKALLRKLRRVDDQRFDLASMIAAGEDWDLLFAVAIGTDRVAHYYMHHLDELHPAHPPDPCYADAIKDHYRHCDARISELLDVAGPETTVLVVSDHGTQRLDGRLSLNDWLASRGFLSLEYRPKSPCSLAAAPVDWGATRAWATGFGGQIFVNRSGRYPLGWLSDKEADAVLDELVGELRSLHDGSKPIMTEVLRGEDVFTGPYAARCPDLCLCFEGMRVLPRNGVGRPQLFERPGCAPGDEDMASHASSGFLAIAGPGIPAAGRCAGLSIYDVAPTILDLLGLGDAGELDGRSLIGELREAYTGEEEAELASRLKSLYLD
jgi:predicted AlkP superfamily phosphohydrolase/phosphomutase